MRLRRPAWWAVVLLLAGVALFVRLGFWQLDRAQQKDALLQRFAHASSQPVQTFSALPDELADDVVPHVRVRGRLQPGHAYVLDNQTRHGRPGVQVFVPMQVCVRASPCKGWQRRALLVAMGFLPREQGWQALPRLPPIAAQTVSLTGLYAPPRGQGLKLGGNALAEQGEWPKLTTYLDLRQVENDLNQSLYPRVLLLDPQPSSAYTRNWSPATMPPARHRAYAFQWFSFALAAIVIFLVMHRKRPSRENDDEHA